MPATGPYPEPERSSPCSPSHFLKIQLNIILLPTIRAATLSLSLKFPQQNSIYTSSLLHTCHRPRNHSSWSIFRITFGEKNRSLRSSLCSFLHSPVTLSLLGPNTLLSTIFSNTFRLRSSLNVSDHVSHPYKTISKIILLYILIFVVYFWIVN